MSITPADARTHTRIRSIPLLPLVLSHTYALASCSAILGAILAKEIGRKEMQWAKS